MNKKLPFFTYVKNTKTLFYYLIKLVENIVQKFLSSKELFFLTAIFFEVKKIKAFLNLHEKIQKLDGKLYVIEKSFVKFFCRKNPQIMRSTEFYQEVRQVLAMLFESLKILEICRQEVMSHPNFPTGQKDTFLFYYELKLEEIKAEFEAIEKIV